MNYVIDILLKFQGIIGALSGVLLALITTQLLKSVGKTYYYFSNWEGNFYGNFNGRQGKTDIISEADSFKYSFKIQIYNSSEIIKILKDITIEIHNDKKIVKNVPIDTGKTEYRDNRYTKSYNLNILNIVPKQILELELHGYIMKSGTNLNDLSKIDAVYFVGHDYKNKKIQKLIKKY